MDDLRFYVSFNSNSVILGRWKGKHERLCAMNCRLGSEAPRLQRDSNLRSRDPKSGALMHFKEKKQKNQFAIKCTTRHSKLLKFIFRKNYYVKFW